MPPLTNPWNPAQGPNPKFVKTPNMKKLYLLSCFMLITAIHISAQETSTPILNKSNRIILHFDDTTGLFTQLARILIDRGYDIEMKDRELGILRTKPSPLPVGPSFYNQLELKTIFRDSTITFSGVGYLSDSKFEVLFTKRWTRLLMLSWEEMMTIAELLKPDFISYLAVNFTSPYPFPQRYNRHN
jgi:hypothetical protein